MQLEDRYHPSGLSLSLPPPPPPPPPPPSLKISKYVIIVIKITISRDYKPNCHSDLCVCEIPRKAHEKSVVFLTTTKDVMCSGVIEIADWRYSLLISEM